MRSRSKEILASTSRTPSSLGMRLPSDSVCSASSCSWITLRKSSKLKVGVPISASGPSAKAEPPAADDELGPGPSPIGEPPVALGSEDSAPIRTPAGSSSCGGRVWNVKYFAGIVL